RKRRESKRIVEWIYVEGLPVMHGAEISRTVQLIADAVHGPKLNVRADPAHTLDFAAKFMGVVGLRYMQPAIDELDAGHLSVQDCAADISKSLFGERPELLGMVEPDALDDAIDVLGKTWKHEAQIAARCRPGHLTRLQHRD